ncbi:MAG: SusC/RagA family TonB-linked outer membrane protein, partial [Prevotella sp.]|nr:SusC/RagA family TonB-linked outer membrane protein [Prevotella sp.]
MKQVFLRIPQRAMMLLFGLMLSVGTFAQITVNGLVKDATGETVIGATVRVVGEQGGTVTDFDGKFVLKCAEGAELQISSVGYQTATVKAKENLIVVLQDDAALLNEVVVIGYGVAKKNDLTGSVTAMKPDAKNKGLVVNAQDMIQGKIAGVNVTNGGGTPGGGATIRIRGGSSLTASNDPLIVIDGVAMDNNGVKGLANPLSMVNPQDIETFTVLKDASATAIYGSRGSNGVIIITTKKGRKGMAPSVSYSGSATISMKQKTYDVMDGNEYRAYVTNMFGEGSEQAQLLGTANTDWQDEIYRTAISHDHNVTVSGSVGENLPYRVSLGYTNQQGIIETSDFKRATAAINLNPSFFDDHLTLNLNAKGMWAKSQYADGAAISAALYYDPTQPVRSDDAKYSNLGGYFQWLSSGAAMNDSQWPWIYNSQATKNPVSILDLKDDRAISRSFIGNAEIDYKLHGFEDLRLHATLGADVSKGTQWTDVSPASPLAQYYGSHGFDTILKRNLSFNAYAQYYKDFNDELKNHLDVMAGYEWQHFWRSQNNDYVGYFPETNNDKSLAGTARPHTPYKFKTESYLVSFFGRLNYSLLDRYLFTATVRHDGTSRFKDHWSTFPSFA